MDFYSVLEIEKNATQEEIQKKYRKLAMQYHPDRNPGDLEAEAKFKELSNAYETLNDPQKRRIYDSQGSINNDYHVNYHDLFDFFGEKPERKGQHGDHIILQVKVDLDSILKGSELDIEFKKRNICQDCKGEGGTQESCPQCKGQGWQLIKGENIQVRRPCSTCGGKCYIVKDNCKTCKGTCLTEPQTDRLQSTIPAGVDHGQQFIFRGRGNAGKKGGRTGNLIVKISVDNHSLFTRALKGDIGCIVPVTFTQLVLGDEVEIPALDNKKVSFRIPPGTQSGSKLRLKKQGLPKFYGDAFSLKPEDHGDLIVELKLETPTALTNEQVALIETMSKYDCNMEHYPIRKNFKKITESLINV